VPDLEEIESCQEGAYQAYQACPAEGMACLEVVSLLGLAEERPCQAYHSVEGRAFVVAAKGDELEGLRDVDL